MTILKSANVTKYDAGGSGDTYIADGYIKSVEKVWIDSTTMGTSALATTDSILIGYVPKGKKITEVVVHMPALNPTPTMATVFIDTGSSILFTGSSTYFGASMKADGHQSVDYDTATAATLRLNPASPLQELPARKGIYLALVVTGGKSVISTGGTIRSIIKYT